MLALTVSERGQRNECLNETHDDSFTVQTDLGKERQWQDVIKRRSEQCGSVLVKTKTTRKNRRIELIKMLRLGKIINLIERLQGCSLTFSTRSATWGLHAGQLRNARMGSQ